MARKRSQPQAISTAKWRALRMRALLMPRSLYGWSIDLSDEERLESVLALDLGSSG